MLGCIKLWSASIFIKKGSATAALSYGRACHHIKPSFIEGHWTRWPLKSGSIPWQDSCRAETIAQLCDTTCAPTSQGKGPRNASRSNPRQKVIGP